MLSRLIVRVRRVPITTAALTIIVITVCFGAMLSPLPITAHGEAKASAAPAEPPSPSPDPTVAPAVPAGPRNAVVILADDLDWSVFSATPEFKDLQKQGATLTNFVVTDSLCCPSRTSLLRGQYVHNHLVKSNVPRTQGGWTTFFKRNLQLNNLPTWLSGAKVSSALIGKYLNGFPGELPATYVPPGWDHFETTVNGNVAYTGYNYQLATNGRVSRPARFLNDKLTTDTLNWLKGISAPFYLEFSSYLPHSPAPASPGDVGKHAGARAPRPPSFNVTSSQDVLWLRDLPPIKRGRLSAIDRTWAQRLDSAHSFARSATAIVDALRRKGVLENTLVVIASDNGYHLGTHRMVSGKGSPFREDTIVPVVIIGGGARPGTTIDAMTSMIDVAPTITEWLGASAREIVDGRSLLPLLADPEGPWRTGVLTEHFNTPDEGDPDFHDVESPPYRALRTKQWLLVDYKGESALYDLSSDPFEMSNIFSTAPRETVQMLRRQLGALSECARDSCRVADMMPVPSPPIDANPGDASQPSATPSASASQG